MTRSHPTDDFPGSAKIRIDAPHTVLREQLVPVAQSAGIELLQLAGRDSDGMLDQLQQQAFELGQRLQQQQCDLDQRQAEFHAQIARVENELRTARLICGEREHDLNEKLRNAIAETEHASGLDVESVDRIFRIDSPASTPIADSRSADKLLGKKWDSRFAELENSERQLQAQIAQLDYDRKKLQEQREQLSQRAESQEAESWQGAAEARRQVEEDLRNLQNWSKELDQRKFAVEALHQDAMRLFKEAIEMRLCTEELCSQIGDSISPTERTQRIAGLRCKLMDQFHLADQRLSDQRGEIETLMETLTQHEQSLRQERDELREWISRRHQEVESDARKLLIREREIDQQQHELNRLKDEWLQQRHEYDQKIRRLKRLTQDAEA